MNSYSDSFFKSPVLPKGQSKWGIYFNVSLYTIYIYIYTYIYHFIFESFLLFPSLFFKKQYFTFFLLDLLHYSNQSAFKSRWSFCKIDDLTIIYSYTPFSLWPQQNTWY